MVDLTDCDREPVHIPGTIQPHGVLLVLAEPGLTVAQVSANVGDHLSRSVEAVLGQPLAELIGAAEADRVRASLVDGGWDETNPLHIDVRGKRFDAIVHRHEGAAILELEPNPEPSKTMPMYHPLRPALMQIRRVTALAELAAIVVEQMRRITGYERVMFYRFHEDGHGSVDAEAKGAAFEPYLGQHYPASDIPAQARQLYLKNWLRLIFDCRATPARIVPTLRVDTRGPLDLSLSVLRSVSPVHLEYMANMGVRASMSISLIVRDRLWGLISCLNHTGPMHVPHELRAACEFLGRLTSLQIAALEDRELLALRTSRRGAEEKLAHAMRDHSPEQSVLAGLISHPNELLSLVGAEGAALTGGAPPVVCGRTPPPALIEDIAAWVEVQAALRPFATDALGTRFPRAAEVSEVASGVLTFALPGAPHRRLLWFRPEFVRTVNWGGDPTKPVTAGSGGLRPRNSFALWREEVRLRSQPWTASDLEAADELYRRALEVDLERRLTSEHRAVQQRDELLAVVSHDLKTPLSSIQLQADAMARQARTAGEQSLERLRLGAERIQKSAARMTALIADLQDLARLEAKRFALRLQAVESRAVVEEAVMTTSPLAQAKQINLALELVDSPTLEADPERLFRVLANLIGNAVKFTPKGGTITVRTQRRGDALCVSVADTGRGITADQLPHLFERYWKGQPATEPGAGLGLYISKGIVEAHGGEIWAESAGAGATLSFTLPLRQ